MIKYLIMDVDGTLTDGKIYMGNDGELIKAFNIKDGYGIKKVLFDHKIFPVVVTGRKSIIVEKRCNELGIEYLYQNIDDKLKHIKAIIKEKNLDEKELAYIGDDDNDLKAMEYISKNGGIIGCPLESSRNILNLKGIYVCKSIGGAGAVREFIDFLVKQNVMNQ